jgi:WD40 repeat protein
MFKIYKKIKVILTASYRNDSCLKLWDIETFECLQEFDVSLGRIICIEISPNMSDLQKLITGTNNGYIYIFDMNNNRPLDYYRAHTDSINSVRIVSDQYFASCSNDKKIILYNFTTLKPWRRLIGHTLSVTDIDVISKEKLVSCSKDFTIRIWNVADGACLKIIQGSYELLSLRVIDEDHISLVTSRPTFMSVARKNSEIVICNWNLTEERIEAEYTPNDYFNNDIKFYNIKKSVSISNKCLNILDIISKKCLFKLKLDYWFIQKLSKNTLITGADNLVQLWNVENGNLIKTLNQKHAIDFIEIF